MKMTEAATQSNLFKALAAAQLEFGTPVKNCVNPAFKSRYADLQACLAACKPALNRHGIFLCQRISSDSSTVSVETVVTHESGETMSSGVLTVPYVATKGNPAQALGSARTYACRYSLCSFLGIAADDDDDGNGAGAQQRQQAPAFVLTEDMVDAAKTEAAKGKAAYKAFFMAQSREFKLALKEQGWHDRLIQMSEEVGE